jgi:choice-of-anchor B domain-containing protein
MGYDVGVNDVCGWVNAFGNEYALVGLNTGVSIVSVDNEPIQEVAFVPGVNNTWRDINTFGHYAYVTTEARVGLTIIDLQYLPDSVKTYIWNDSIPTPNGLRAFEKAHTLWIDEYGIAYLNGSNLNSGGVVMIDVASNPTDPVFLGMGPAIYSHDSYARDSILYSAEIYAGDVSLYDIHDPQNVQLIGRVKTPNEFTHNAWLSDDSKYMFTTDERSNSYVAAYDIQDPANIVEVDRFRQAATDGTGAIPHNVYVWNDWLVIAYYTNGTLIVDAARPDNLIEVGSFDSFLGPHGGFSGVWGSYPFLPSGKILTSDRNSGLFVFDPTYVRAAYLEGIVLDSITSIPIQGAVVTILSNEITLPQTTGLDGRFKTGKAIPGTYDIRVTKAGYYPKVLQGNFVNGELWTPLVELNPLPTYIFSGSVVSTTGSLISNAQVIVTGSEGTYQTVTDGSGNFIFPAVFGGSYHVQAGIWGEWVETDIIVEGPQNITLTTVKGYRDDFDLDLGWTVAGDATQGEWEQGVPTGQLLFDIYTCGSGTDSPNDMGPSTYSTGLSSSGDVSEDVVEGITHLVSPPMDLDSIFLAHIYFDLWLCEFPPNQYLGLTMWITNSADTILLAEFSNNEVNGSWITRLVDFEISNFPEGTRDAIQIFFTAKDTSTLIEYYLKAHIDNFKLVEGALSTHDEAATDRFIVYPNPVNGPNIYLKNDRSITGNELLLNVFDIQGRKIASRKISLTHAEQGFNHGLEDGVYFLKWLTDEGLQGIQKIIVLQQ